MIDTLLGLAAAKYICSGWKSEVDLMMDRAMTPVTPSRVTLAEREAQKRGEERQQQQDQYERIGKLLAQIKNYPDYSRPA